MRDREDPDAADAGERRQQTDGGPTAGSDIAGPASVGEPDVAHLRLQRRLLERRNDRLAAVMRAIAHDIRSPLVVASDHAELAREEPTSEHFEGIVEAHDRLETLVDRLAAMADEDRGALDPRPVELAERVAAAWRGIDHGAATLVVDTDTTIVADRARLGRLLGNLLRNAVEHGSASPRSGRHEDAARPDAPTPGSAAGTDQREAPASGSTRNRGRRTDSAAVEHGPDRSGSSPGQEAVGTADLTVTVGDIDGGFSVCDDGPGVPAEDREEVFEEGYTTADTGTGLGLSIVRDVATAHGWTVDLTDSDAGGARFEITGVRRWPGA